MCGIYYGKKKDAWHAYTNQIERGTDSIGIMSQANIVRSTKSTEYKKTIEKIAEDDNENIFLHHRKATVGSVSVEAAHPYLISDFYIAQNGTCHPIHHWADIEGLNPISDTHALGMYLSRFGSIEQKVQALDELSLCGYRLGVVFLRKNNNAAIWADGDRSLFLEMDSKKLYKAVSKNALLTEHKTVGHIIFKFNSGDIISTNLSILNEVKPTVYNQYTGIGYELPTKKEKKGWNEKLGGWSSSHYWDD